MAVVLAESAAAARDGAERVVVAWDPLPVVTTAATALAEGAPALYEDHPSNVCVDSRAGDMAAADAAFARAAHVVRLSTRINRVTGVPMEPRTAVAAYDAATGSLRAPRRVRGRAAVPRRPRRHARRGRGHGAGDGRRRRGQLRHAEQLLPGVRSHRLGSPAPRPARQVDVRPHRGAPHRLSEPRSPLRGRAGPGCRRDVPRPARGQHEQCRRPRGVLHPPRQGRGRTAQRVPHSRRRDGRARRPHQHRPHHAVSERGPARGDVRDRAPHRPRGAPPRLRPRRAAAAQPRSPPTPCPIATRWDSSTTAAITRWPRTARSRARTGRVSRRGARRPADAGAIAASGSPTTSSSTRARPASAPRSPFAPRARWRSRSARCRPGRAMRPASPSSSPNGSASRSAGCVSSPATPTGCPWAAARTPDGPCGWAQWSWPGRPTRSSREAPGWRPGSSRPLPKTSPSRADASRCAAPIARSTSSRWPPPRSAPMRRPVWAGRSPAPATRP